MIGAITSMAPVAGAMSAMGGALGPAGGVLSSMNPFDLRTIDVAYMFTVLINGLPVGEFHAVDGLSRSVTTEEYYEGGRNHQPLNLIKHGKYADLTLKWGLVQRGYFFNWMSEVQAGYRFRRDLVIMMQDRMLLPTRVFTIIGAYPVEWTSAPLDGQNSNVPVETLKLKYHSLDMVARHVV